MRAVPLPHQAEAVEAAATTLAGGGAALVTMACGTGKTLVGLWVAEALDVRRVVVLVPSLGLVAQVLAAWRSTTSWEGTRWLAVCSVADVADDASVEVVTDPEAVVRFLDSPGRAVVVATYQSSPVLMEAGVRFDLAVADEAHHCAGVLDGPFSAVVRGDLAADRRLFMTATPRLLRRRNSRDDVEAVGMDDVGRFGPRVYDLRLGAAIEAGLAADYRVVLAAVEPEVFRTVAGTLGTDVDPHLLAGVIATVRTMGELGLGRCVSFHSRVGRAREFAALVGPVASALGPGARPEGPGWAAWLHGETRMRTRREVLERLGVTGQAGPGWGVVANARCLGEGVDVPALDTVAIVDPKSSEVDVAQAVGRALRVVDDSQKVGTVVLPVLVGEGATPGEALDARCLEVAGGVLRALRAHDDALASRLDAGRRRLGRHPASVREWRRVLGEKLVVQLPPSAAPALAEAMALHLVRGASASWDEMFGRLETWVADHGHARVPQDEFVERGAERVALGTWVGSQRSLYRRGALALEREAALESLPGWSWEPRDEQWWAQHEALADWAAVHGHANCPQRTVHRGLAVGSFTNVVRLARKAGTLSSDRAAALEALPGWTWDVRRAGWDGHLGDLRAWVADHGHARPSHGDCVDGFDLGRWVAKQRVALRSGTLEPDQVAALRGLPGWVDHERDAAWEAGMEVLGSWTASRGHARAPQVEVVDGFQLGAWATKQRTAYRAGRLGPERARRLEALPGWTWEPRQEGWEQSLAALHRFVGREGHARVPDGHLEDGFALGAWVRRMRAEEGSGRLAAERTTRLAQVPGWGEARTV